MGAPFDVPEPLPLAEQKGQTFPRLVELMQRCRPTAVPDQAQDFKSLRRYARGSVVIDAIDGGDTGELPRLRDLRFRCLWASSVGRRIASVPTMRSSIIDKLVRRRTCSPTWT
jgi:hypothetical protein